MGTFDLDQAEVDVHLFLFALVKRDKGHDILGVFIQYIFFLQSQNVFCSRIDGKDEMVFIHTDDASIQCVEQNIEFAL